MLVVDHTPRLDTMRVIERISRECIGGTQIFYSCETWQGLYAQFSEDGLIPGRAAFDQWCDAFMVQEKRLNEKKKRPGGT
jgi:hypothetical protein